jgi:hypothetical protein
VITVQALNRGRRQHNLSLPGALSRDVEYTYTHVIVRLNFFHVVPSGLREFGATQSSIRHKAHNKKAALKIPASTVVPVNVSGLRECLDHSGHQGLRQVALGVDARLFRRAHSIGLAAARDGVARQVIHVGKKAEQAAKHRNRVVRRPV